MYDRIKLAQTNIENILKAVRNWCNQPLYERKDGKKEQLLNMEDRTERIQKRTELVTTCSNNLQRILKENCILLLKMSLDEKPPEPEVIIEPESPKPEEKSPKGAKGRNDQTFQLTSFSENFL